MIYLASPYSRDPENLYAQAVELTSRLIKRGTVVYSPIVHCHPLHCHDPSLPHTFDFWKKHNFGILRKCSELWVARFSGWDISTGVQAEMSFAKKSFIPTYLVDPSGAAITPIPHNWSER